MTYAIKDWDETFENNKSRAIKNPSYVAWPVRRDSEAFTFLSRAPNFLEAFGLFGLLVQLAARCSTRGLLQDDRGDLTPERVARRYGLKAEAVSKAWATLAGDDVGWLVTVGGEAPSARTQAVSDHAPARSAALSSHITPSHPSPPLTSPPEPKPRPTGADLPGFAEWWSLYPSENGRKGDKKQCAKKWVADGLESRAKEIVKALKRFVKSSKWKDQGGQFIPAPLVWLNREQYDNPPPTELHPLARRVTYEDFLKLEASFGQGPAIEPPSRAFKAQTLPEGGSSIQTQQGGSNGK